MAKRAVEYAESTLIIAVVALAMHYVAGLDWSWALIIGAVASITLRWLIHRGTLGRLWKRPPTGAR